MNLSNIAILNINTSDFRCIISLISKNEAIDVDIEKVLVSNKISFGEKNYKYFIGYLYNEVKPYI